MGPKARITVLLLAGLSIVMAAVIWVRYLRNGPAVVFADPVEHFKYGSIGAEANGIPFPIWKAMPIVCKDLLPGGYAALGFIQEAGHTLPIGVSVRQYGVDRVGFNCATCHSLQLDGVAQPVLGAPASQLDLAAYTRFVLQCGQSASFTSSAVMDAIDAAGVRLSLPDRLAYRFIVVPRTRTGIVERGMANSWTERRPRPGPGRTDALNPWRQRFDMRPENDDLIATVDFPSIWNQRVRTGMWLHWDADNNSLAERNLSAALAGGATETSLDHDSIRRVTEWLTTLTSPRFPVAIDDQKALAGRSVYQQAGCGGCHNVGSPHVGQSTPLAAIGTDPSRVKALTPALLAKMLTVGTGYPWRFTHYRAADGYANSPLDGIWARAPYLHNGSVPTLDDLFKPAAQRPRAFWRGCRTFDPVKVGFACTSSFSFLTDLPGNDNAGHEYGTHLSVDERAALVEYLKTL